MDDLAAKLEAMQRAVRAALGRHKRAGNPVAIWRDGAIVMVPPENIPGDDEEPAPAGETQQMSNARKCPRKPKRMHNGAPREGPRWRR